MSTDEEFEAELGAVFDDLIDLIGETNQAAWTASSSERRQTFDLKSYLAEQAAAIDVAERRTRTGDPDRGGGERCGYVLLRHRATKAQLEQFEQAAAHLAAQDRKPTRLRQLELDAVNPQADDLRAGIADYEQLRSSQVSTFTAGTLAELATTVLVKAGVARGRRQRELANALGVAKRCGAQFGRPTGDRLHWRSS